MQRLPDSWQTPLFTKLRCREGCGALPFVRRLLLPPLPGKAVAESLPKVLYLGTGNPHKLAEFERLAPSSLSILPSLAPPVEETGKTFLANAFIKAKNAALSFSGPPGQLVFADDSGLVVPALGGEPGVLSARYAGEGASDLENREALQRKMKGVPPEERGAFFVCILVAALSGSGRLAGAAAGYVYGKIARGPMGEGGFGYDPLFVPEGYRVSFGLMAPEEKNRISHRAKAFINLLSLLGFKSAGENR